MAEIYPDLGVQGLLHGLHLDPLSDPETEKQIEEIRSTTPIYDHKLYNIQLSAPKPNPIRNRYEDEDKPAFYGDEYHGKMERSEVARVVGSQDGNYIVRESVTQPGKYSLSFTFGGQIKHYLLGYKNGKHCIGNKEFDTIQLLVADGLISLHVQKEGTEHITRCITMKRLTMAKKRKKQPSTEPSQHQYLQIEDETPLVPDEVEPDGLRPACLRAAPGRNRSTVKVSSYYGSEAATFEKKHLFKVKTYIGFPFCDFCSNYLWGLTQQGFQCQDCGMNVHQLCRDEIPHDCKPSKKRITKVFGVDLTTVVKVRDIENIPPVLHRGMSIIEGRGIDTEGIYRVNGSFEDINRYKDQLDSSTSESCLEKADVFVVCSLLKQYLRELPMPLVTDDAYQPFLEANRLTDHEERVRATKGAIRLLPHSHFHTLKALIEHLARIAANSQKNAMTCDNLATVFGPTIFRPTNMTPESLYNDMAHQKAAVRFMLDHCWRLLR